SFEPLIKPVIAKPERVDYGGALRVIPLHSEKMDPCVVIRPPIRLSDRLVIHDQTAMRTDVILAVDGVLFAGMQVNLGETAVDVIFGVQAPRYVCAGCAVDIRSARERPGQIKNRIAGSPVAVRIESRNFQAGRAQWRAGGPGRIAS